MTPKDLRQKYLDFFKEKGHAIIPSAPVVPENDPTVLFTTAGMHPLVPYLLGEKHPEGKRLANVQKCVRTNDIDEVGDPTHNTFFEMLGNWSLGDYFKTESIAWSWEFLTSSKWMGLDKNRLAVSVFEGDQDAPFDQEAFDIWREIGVSEKRIAKLPKANNWWGPAGETGPCGPDTEIFYWVGDSDNVPEGFNDDNDLWVEIWNNVFMEFNKKADGTYEKLSQQNVDTGMGLERLFTVISGGSDIYRTDLFWPIVEKMQTICKKDYEENKEIRKAMRIITDHLRAAVFMVADGVVPSNVERGYILRRLIRRAIRQGKILGIESNFTNQIAEVVAREYGEAYPELISNKEKVFEELEKEENKFRETLEKGLKQLGGIIAESRAKEIISGDKAFYLFSTYGFPLELTKEIAKEHNLTIDEEEFYKEFSKHQELSRTASAGQFASGLADHSEEVKKLHTATHLLNAALRKVLGDHVFQKGSNITGERLRFDFSHNQKMTPEQIREVENLVNNIIKQDAEVQCAEVPIDEAKSMGAIGVFGQKYGERVKVYIIGGSSIRPGQEFSKEICGGPHVEKTGELGSFRIVKEEASSAGVRRIKAVLE
ncbi:MAG: Alanine-tRNA ligase [Parcubacteria group bacterium GW2011_GWF2_39_13b]|nr:MAG: Alanine-tRNA ligase [Parcubacteria group bacterium GW2011_GWF2_39_13b]